MFSSLVGIQKESSPKDSAQITPQLVGASTHRNLHFMVLTGTGLMPNAQYWNMAVKMIQVYCGY